MCKSRQPSFHACKDTAARMYSDIRQFKPALYVLLLLGISGFCVSAQTPGIWVVGCFFILLHAWLARRGRFRPMPRIVSNIVILGVVIFVGADALLGAQSVGADHRGVSGSRATDQAVGAARQSRLRHHPGAGGLLLMVAAAISTASLWFGCHPLVFPFVRFLCIAACCFI